MKYLMILVISFSSASLFAYGLDKDMPDDIENIFLGILCIIGNGGDECGEFITVEKNDETGDIINAIVNCGYSGKEICILEKIGIGRNSCECIISIPTNKRELIFRGEFYKNSNNKVVLDRGKVLFGYKNTKSNDDICVKLIK